MAMITAAIERQEKILVVSPSQKQSEIIMHNVIDHLFDDEDITAMLQFDPQSIERLKKERSKERITFRNDSEIFILTADVRTISKNALNLMGFGGTMVIADEAALIPDDMFSKILRMVGGSEKAKLVKLGNTFYKNHFFRSINSSRYEKVVVPYTQGIEEGRITNEFIEEAREDMPAMDFEIFYECKFPEGGAEDSVIPYNWLEAAVGQAVGGDIKQVGIDVARFGKDNSVYTLREGGQVKRMEKTNHQDTMALVGWIGNMLEEDKPDKIAIDVVGIGAGVYDRLEELGYPVVPINVGESPTDPDAKNKFFNLRAEVFWHLRDLFKPDNGKSLISIPEDGELINELSEIRYYYSSERKIRIEDKEDMKKRLGRSPDKADSLALAFFDLEGREPELIIM